VRSGPTAFKVGLFVLVAISLAIGALVALGAGAFARERILIETYLRESVHGLTVGSPVKLRGVQIGAVEEITFGRMRYPDDIQTFEDDPDKLLWGQYVVVVAAINPRAILPTSDLNVESLIKDRVDNQGLRIQLALEGISGLLYVEFDYDLASENDLQQPPWTPQHPVVPAVSSLKATFGETITNFLDDVNRLEVGEVFQRVEETLTEVSRIARGVDVGALQSRLTTLLDEISSATQRFDRLLASADERNVVGSASAALGEIESAARSANAVLNDVQPDLAPTIASLRKVADRLESLLATPELEAAVGNVARTSENLADTSDELPGLVASGRRSLERIDLVLAGGQADLARLIESLRRTAENLERLTAAAAQHPSGALFGDPPPPARANR